MVSHCILSILVFKDGEVYFWCMSLLSVVYLVWNNLDSSGQSDLDNTEDVIDNELLLLSKPWSRESEGNLGDWGLWSLHHLLCLQPLDGLWGEGVAGTVISWYIPWGNSLGGGTRRAGGPVASHRDIQLPLPLLDYLIWLEQWPFYPHELSLGWQQCRLISHPHTCSCEEECSISSLFCP